VGVYESDQPALDTELGDVNTDIKKIKKECDQPLHYIQNWVTSMLVRERERERESERERARERERERERESERALSETVSKYKEYGD